MGPVSRGPGREWVGSVEGGGPRPVCKSPHIADVVSPDGAGEGLDSCSSTAISSPTLA